MNMKNLAKKLFAGVAAVALSLCCAVPAFAKTTTYTDQSTVTIKKVYKLTNAGTTSPAETFTVTQVGDGKVKDGDATSAPALGTITGATFAEGAATVTGAEANITIALPTYTTVGVYEYTLKETVGTTGGVTYRTDNIKLVVTVIQGSDGKIRVGAVHTETSGGTKTGSIENTYSAAGGENGGLKISKTVSGNLGDHDKYFKVTVTLNGETGKTYANSYTVTGGSKMEDGTSACTSSTITLGTAKDFYIKDGETLTVQNVPYGVTYTVDEADYTKDGYTATGEVTTAGVDAAAETVSITNTKTGNVDTGIIVNNLPFIVIGAAAVAGLAVMAVRRRSNEQ